jgi:hypothetical protein
MKRPVFAIVAALMLPGEAEANEVGPGAYDLVEPEGHRRCRIALLAAEGAAPVGPARIPAACRVAFPSLRLAQAWRPAAGGGLALMDPHQRVVVDLRPHTEDEWRGESGGLKIAARRSGVQPRLRRELPPLYARPAPPPVPSAEQRPAAEISGLYRTMRTKSGESCNLALTERASAKSGRVVELTEACTDRGLVIFSPTIWRYEGGRIVLIARKGHEIRFAWDEAGKRWRKDPPSGAELYLQRL